MLHVVQANGGLPKTMSQLSLASTSGADKANGLDDMAAQRTVTGVLTSRPTARDIKIDGFSMGLGGAELIQVRQLLWNRRR